MQDWKNIFAFRIGSISLRLHGLESTAEIGKNKTINSACVRVCVLFLRVESGRRLTLTKEPQSRGWKAVKVVYTRITCLKRPHKKDRKLVIKTNYRSMHVKRSNLHYFRPRPKIPFGQ